MKLHGIFILFVFFCSATYAQSDSEFQEALPPPELSDPIQSGQAIEPEVTIIRKEDQLIEEYRINGSLYMVKITPSIGPAYYLIDQDGDGKLESRTSRLGSESTAPQWILFQW